MDKLSWGLCIATKDRLAVLERAVECALDQTRLPSEIVVADSSADWEQHAARIRDIVSERMPGLPVVYEQGAAPSLTVQRNQAAGLASADVLFMIDDDSLMHPDCAEEVMRVYEADPNGKVAGVQTMPSPDVPGRAPEGGQKHEVDVKNLRRRSRVLKWVLSKVLLMEKTAVFIPYDKAFHMAAVPDDVAHLAVNPVEMFGGFRMTFRRKAVLDTPFDPTLRYYCPGEDLDGSYRISRHGLLLTAQNARLHHFVSADARLNRRQVAHLWSLNQAVLLRRHAPDQVWAQKRYRALMRHRILADAFKDLVSRRLDFPQTRGSFAALKASPAVFAMTADEIADWYPDEQQRIVKGG